MWKYAPLSITEPEHWPARQPGRGGAVGVAEGGAGGRPAPALVAGGRPAPARTAARGRSRWPPLRRASVDGRAWEGSLSFLFQLELDNVYFLLNILLNIVMNAYGKYWKCQTINKLQFSRTWFSSRLPPRQKVMIGFYCKHRNCFRLLSDLLRLKTKW